MEKATERRSGRIWLLVACTLVALAAVLAMALASARPAMADGRFELAAGNQVTVTGTSDETITFTTPAPKSGYLYYVIQVIGGDGSISSSIESNYTNYWNGDSISYGDAQQTTAAVSLPENQTVELKTELSSETITFSVKAVVVTPDSFETEPNDQIGPTSASVLVLDQAKTGVANDPDVDFFTHSADVDGNYTISLRVIQGPTTKEFTSDSLEVNIYKGENEETDYGNVDGGNDWTPFKTVFLNSGERLYAKVANYNSYLDDADVLYEIKVTCVPYTSASTETTTPVEPTTTTPTTTTTTTTTTPVTPVTTTPTTTTPVTTTVTPVTTTPATTTTTTVTPVTTTPTTTTTTSYPTPKKPSLKSVKGKKKSLVVKWKKVSGVSGYKIRYSTSKSMKGTKKYKTIKGSKVKTTIKNLKSGKRYYVQVQSYKKYSGKTMRSSWSKVKSAQVK